MPLSSPVARQHIHSRDITCRGFHRDDGLWDIEARIVDTKTYTFSNNDRGQIAAGEPLHDMSLRVTIDDDMVIQAVEAVTDAAPYSICGEVAPNFQHLVGLSIKPGFSHQVTRVIGRTNGCTHLVELLRPLATTAFQTLHAHREKLRKHDRPGEPPRILDTCYALRSDGPVVAREWPDFYIGLPTDTQVIEDSPTSGDTSAAEKTAS